MDGSGLLKPGSGSGWAKKPGSGSETLYLTCVFKSEVRCFVISQSGLLKKFYIIATNTVGGEGRVWHDSPLFKSVPGLF